MHNFFKPNILASLTAILSYLAISALWSLIFGRDWMVREDKNTTELPKTSYLILTYVGAALFSTYAMDNFIKSAEALTLINGAFIGFSAWVLILSANFVKSAYCNTKQSKIGLIQNIYFLVNFLVIGAILGYMG